MSRRRAGELLDSERRVLAEVYRLSGLKVDVFGMAIMRALMPMGGGADMARTGSVYKTLRRLEETGYLVATWEDWRLAERETRPRRRLYRLTEAGLAVVMQQPAGGI